MLEAGEQGAGVSFQEYVFRGKLMGRKAKIKKTRQKKQDITQSVQKYDQTQFVKQFESLGYQLNVDPKLQPKTNRGNISPEIPENRIEPQL
jgi:hypothetical protein